MSLLADLRYAARTLIRQPSFSVAAVVTLAVGIAANTIAFTLLNALALRPMPVPRAERVVRVYPVDRAGKRDNLFSYPDYVDYRNQAHGFDALAAYIPADVTLGRSTSHEAFVEPQAALAYVVSPEYFDITGMRPSLGRVLGQPDERQDGTPAVVISYALWHSRFAGDPAILGGTLTVNGQPFTIVGVSSPQFAGTEPLVADLWVPVAAHTIVDPGLPPRDNRDSPRLLMIGRLSPHVTRHVSAETLTVIAHRLAASYPGEARPWDVVVSAGTFFTLDPGARSVVALVMAIVGLVLLIACANVATLTLARAAARQREVAVRLAIGAGRWRIVRQLLTESLLVALLAGGIALLITEWVLRALYAVGLSLMPFPFAIAINLTPDVRVFTYTFGLAVAAASFFGFAPALQSSSPAISRTLHEDAAVLYVQMKRSQLRNALVVAQIAGSLMLLVAAALLARSLQSARTLDVGFTTADVLYAEYDLEKAGYSVDAGARFNEKLRERVARQPGVRITGFTSHVPLHGGVQRTEVRLGDSHEAVATVVYSVVSPEYFEVLEVPVTAGRNFNDDDVMGRTSAAIVSEELARRFWPGRTPLGQALFLKASPLPLTVVGVVRDTTSASIWREREMLIYVPASRTADARRLSLLLRTDPQQAGIPAAMRRLASELDPDLRFEAKPLDTLLQLWILPSRIAAIAAAVLGTIALMLASIGIYGVLAYVVSQRTREIGIRMALGASARDIVQLVLGDGSRLIGSGLMIGIAGAMATAPLLGALLFDIRALDPLAFILASLVLTTVALAACYLPARRAAALEPLTALRTE